MCVGGFAYSFVTGILSSLISSSDSNEAVLKEKITTLNEIMLEYDMDEELYNKLLKNLQLDFRKRSKEFTSFLDDLPMKLRMEVLMLMHQSKYKAIKYFSEKDRSFIAWVAPHLKIIIF